MNVAPRLTALVGASPTLLELDHASISYPTRDGILTAVEDASFTLSAGERLVLLGPSGCGKSTLLRAVGGEGRRRRGADDPRHLVALGQ
jgi:NitT/TauT family transport system ATP-binding protein